MGCACCKGNGGDSEASSGGERTPLLRENKMLRDFRNVTNMNAASFMRVWRAYDKNADGYIEGSELDGLLDALVKCETKETSPVKIDKMKQHLLQMYDTNRDRRFTMSEFTRLLPVERNFLGKFPKRNTLTKADYDEIFNHYDEDNSGHIDLEEMLALIKDLFQRDGQSVSGPDLDSYTDAICEIYDIDKDGKITREELGLLLAKSA